MKKLLVLLIGLTFLIPSGCLIITYGLVAPAGEDGTEAWFSRFETQGAFDPGRGSIVHCELQGDTLMCITGTPN